MNDFDERLRLLAGIKATTEMIEGIIESGEVKEIEGVMDINLQEAFSNLEKDGIINLAEAWRYTHRINEGQTRTVATGLDDLEMTRTNQTFQRLVNGARQNVTIMGYDITQSDLTKSLQKKIDKGVSVHVLTEKVKSGMQSRYKKFLSKWISESNNVRLWSYEPDDSSKMHIKCMVVDETQAYLGSANFSYHGSNKNIELGVQISDKKVISDIMKIFDYLTNKHPLIQEMALSDLRGNK